jgi:hypothetical protein
MRYLCLHPKTKEELELWAGDKKLVFAHFFFWNSGDELQMSLQGLYRSVLFEALRQCPELIPDVFRVQWERISAGNVDDFESVALFRAPMITEAFRILVSRTAYSRHRFCFFIDGLDEYSGSGVDSIAHKNFAEKLKMWASNNDIKICVSSRPHREFMNTFCDSPGIRLHELTRHDIRVFSQRAFEKNENFNRVKNTYTSLVDKVVERSEGVFLWARLAVHSILICLARYDPSEVLEEQLQAIPADLDTLYDRLLNSIPPQDRRRSDRMLLITVLNPFRDPLNAIVYTWLDDLENDPQFPRGHKYSEEEINRRFQAVQHQLDGYTRGMLEMVKHGQFDGQILGLTRRVEFLHRTLRDYLLSEPRRSRIVDQFPSFNPAEAYARLRLAEVTLLVPEHGTLEEDRTDLADFALEPLSILKFNGFRKQELSLDLLGRFNHVAQSYEGVTSFKEFRDWQYVQITDATSLDPLSFPHLAAYRSQFEYVVSEVTKNRKLLKPAKDLSLLLSAVAGGSPDLVLALLNMGVSLNDKFDVSSFHEVDEVRSSPTVIQATVCEALSQELVIGMCGRGRKGYGLPDHDQIVRLCMILEYFLQRGMEPDYYFLLQRCSDWDGDEPLNVVSLQKLVRILNPPNLDSLLHLFESRTRNGFVGHAKRILSNLVPWMGPAATSVETNSEYVELQPETAQEFCLRSICSGTSQLPGWYQVRLY